MTIKEMREEILDMIDGSIEGENDDESLSTLYAEKVFIRDCSDEEIVKEYSAYVY